MGCCVSSSNTAAPAQSEPVNRNPTPPPPQISAGPIFQSNRDRNPVNKPWSVGHVFRIQVHQALKLRSRYNPAAQQSSLDTFDPVKNPSVKIDCPVGAVAFTTGVAPSGGESPAWNEEFFFAVGGSDGDVFFILQDHDPNFSTFEVGFARVHLSRLVDHHTSRQCWVPLIDRRLQGESAFVGELGFSVTKCYRMGIRVDLLEMPPVPGSTANFVSVQAGSQYKLDTPDIEDPTYHVFNSGHIAYYYVPYGEETELLVSAWSKFGTNRVCRGYHAVTLRGAPRPPGSAKLLQLPLGLNPVFDGAAMRVGVALEEFTDDVGTPFRANSLEDVPYDPPSIPSTMVFDFHLVGASDVAETANDSYGVFATVNYRNEKLTTKLAGDLTNPQWCETFTFDDLPVREGYTSVNRQRFDRVGLGAMGIAIMDHNVNASTAQICKGRADLSALGPSAQIPLTVDAAQDPLSAEPAKVEVVLRSRFAIVVKVRQVELFQSRDPRGVNDLFVDFTMASQSFRTRCKLEDRVPRFNDEFRFWISPTDVRRDLLELRLGVHELQRYAAHDVRTAVIGFANADIEAAIRHPRLRVTIVTPLMVAGQHEGNVTLQVTSEYLPRPNQLVIHRARYGFDPTGHNQLWDLPEHTGADARTRTPNDPPPTWKDVTKVARGLVENNRLFFSGNNDPNRLCSTFWPEAPAAPSSNPNSQRYLTVRYTIGAGEVQEAMLFDMPLAGSASHELEITAEEVDTPGWATNQLSTTSFTDSPEELAKFADRKVKELQDELAAVRSSGDRARIQDLESLITGAERNAKIARAALLSAQQQDAVNAAQQASAEAAQAEQLHQLREDIEADAKLAEEGRADRESEEADAKKREAEQREAMRRLEEQLRNERAQNEARRQLEADRQRLQQQMAEQEKRRRQLQEQERQARLMQERIDQLRRQEEESVRRAQQAQQEAERKAAEARRLAEAAKLRARISPTYWSPDADSRDGLTRVELNEPVWRSRFQALLDDTCRRNTLGAGRDQIIRDGKYDRLELHRAWRLENAKLYGLYAAHRDNQIAVPSETLHPSTHSVPSSQWINELGLRTAERNEVLLWHGTKPDVVDLIATDGFDERICRLSGLFGAGVYFADEVSKSDQYVTPTPANDPRNGVYHILLVRVTMGAAAHITSGTKDARRAPAGCQSILGQIDRNKYREYVIYDGWLAYPEFLIQYKRRYV